MRVNISRSWQTLVVLTFWLVPGILTGCFMDVGGDGHDSGRTSSHWPTYSSDTIPAGAGSNAELCGKDEMKLQTNGPCFKAEDYIWRVNCTSASCQRVPVTVHYMLTQDIGESQNVVVEAFNNDKFAGNPVSTVTIGHFSATHPGEYRESELWLAPGIYYARAYLSNSDQLTTPYQYNGMQLVSNEPMGVFGALSGIETITVAPAAMEPWAKPLNIYLDKLFKSPQSEKPTNAHLRVQFNIDPAGEIPMGRKVLIQLHTDDDLSMKPEQAFEVASESFLIEGQHGKAEFVSPSLPVGKYVVFAWLDLNSNGFYDKGEPAQLSMKLGQPYLIDIRADRTADLALDLKADFALPSTVPQQ